MSRYRWDTGDTCFFLDSSRTPGEFPLLYKGIVISIQEDALGVEVVSDRPFHRHKGERVHVERTGCFPTVIDLIKKLQEHLQGDFNCCPFETDWFAMMRRESEERI